MQWSSVMGVQQNVLKVYEDQRAWQEVDDKRRPNTHPRFLSLSPKIAPEFWLSPLMPFISYLNFSASIYINLLSKMFIKWFQIDTLSSSHILQSFHHDKDVYGCVLGHTWIKY